MPRVGIDALRKLRPLFSARGVSAEVSTTNSAFTVVIDSDVIIDPSWFQVKSKLFIRFLAHLKNTTSGSRAQAQLYRRGAGTAVSGTTVTVTSTAYQIADSGWVDFGGESGLEAYQVQIAAPDGGTTYINCSVILIAAEKYP